VVRFKNPLDGAVVVEDLIRARWCFRAASSMISYRAF